MLAGGCATGPVNERDLPIEKRLFSADTSVRADAFKEYRAFKDKGKNDAIDRIVELFSGESDPDTQMRMIIALRELKAGKRIIIPVIDSVKKNKDTAVQTTIAGLIRESGPAAEKDVAELADFLKQERWAVRMLAMTALGLMSKKASEAVPEIIISMRKSGDDREKYDTGFNTLAMIDNDVAISAVIADIKSTRPEIRKNAVEKLFELQVYLSPKTRIKKEIMPALIRALYSKDENVSGYAEEALKTIEDPQAKKAVESYLKLGRRLLTTFMKAAGTSMKESFEAQEGKALDRIKEYFIKAGREREFERLRKKEWE